MFNINVLLEALDLLSVKLKARNIKAELTIVGSVAVELNGYTMNRLTRDIDFLGEQPDSFFDVVNEVAEELNLPHDWLNSRASTISPLPEEIESEVRTDNSRSNLTLRVIKPTLIAKFKIYAIYMRNENKDIQDLKTIGVTKDQIDDSVEWIKTIVIEHHGKPRLERDLMEIEKFRSWLNEEFC